MVENDAAVAVCRARGRLEEPHWGVAHRGGRCDEAYREARPRVVISFDLVDRTDETGGQMWCCGVETGLSRTALPAYRRPFQVTDRFEVHPPGEIGGSFGVHRLVVGWGGGLPLNDRPEPGVFGALAGGG